jgi:hypothetical protein
MYKKGEPSWPKWIKKRVRNNLNFVALFTGDTGVGKSWSAIEISRQIDPEFNSVKQVAFNFAGLMRIINKFNNEGLDDELYNKKYKVVIFDEAQTDVNRHEWQSKTNKFLNYVLSTFRHQNIIVFFTTPFEDYIDSNALKLFHAKFECQGWSKKTKKSTLRPKIFQYNPQKRKMYNHSLHIITKTGVKKMVTWNINCPPKELTDPYEKEKFKFTNALNMKITLELEAMEKADNEIPKNKQLNPLSCQPDIWEEVNKNGYKTQQKLADKLGLKASNMNNNIKSMQKKGYDIEKFKIFEN